MYRASTRNHRWDGWGITLFCTPDAFDNGQAADLIKRYLKEHPERGGESASRVVSDALVKAYPCKNKGVDL